MTDTAKKVLLVTRNGITCPFVETKSPRTGQIYYSPDIIEGTPAEGSNQISLSDFTSWAGGDVVLTKLQQWINLTAQTAMFDATHAVTGQDADGKDVYQDKEFSEEQFISDIANLYSRGEKLAELEKKQQQYLQKIIDVGTKYQEAMDTNSLERLPTITVELLKIKQDLSNLAIAMERKRRKPRNQNVEDEG